MRLRSRAPRTAGVAAKWFLPSRGEPLTHEASELLERYATGDIGFLVPDLFWAELGNIFGQAVRHQRWSRANETALRAARDRNFPTLAALPLLDDAFSIALDL
jgi:predicted nucleic acid-binding protein